MRGPITNERAFFKEDGGFSTVGMVLAMLITLSLIFSSAQIYKLQSASANVQNVADAAALAAENQVASFYIVAQVCDAIVLSMSLMGICSAGLGIACLCTPFTAEFSTLFIDAAEKVFNARNSFAREASEGLSKLQKALPFIAAAQAFSIALSNSGTEGTYFGCAVLFPVEGEETKIDELENADGLMRDIEKEEDVIRESAQRAEDAAREANEHKMVAFEADCGNDPGYCMYQRAATLAGMSGSSNPIYRSVDAWSFSVALKRAQSYYPARLAIEVPQDNSVSEQANSAIRANFYKYASDEMKKGFVRENIETGEFEAYFPRLPRNTSQMRETALYVDPVYPLCLSSDETRMLHAWSGCPGAQSQEPIGFGSISLMESEGFDICSDCGLSAVSVGKVAAASSSIENGFEYHYLIVANEAEAYQSALERLKPEKDTVKSKVEGLFGELRQLAEKAISMRIQVSPPGHYGAVSIVMCADGISSESFLPSSFVSSGGTLGARAAISAATLAEDDSQETKNAITSLLDGFSNASGVPGGFSRLLDLWSAVLRAYSDGYEAIVAGVRESLGKLPLVGQSGLGSWVSEKLVSIIEDLGLQPAELSAYKPVLVNSGYILRADGKSVSQGFLKVKTTFSSVPVSGSFLSAAISALGSISSDLAIEGENKLLIASVDFFGIDGVSFPFSIALPPAVSGTTSSAIDQVFEKIKNVTGNESARNEWE